MNFTDPAEKWQKGSQVTVPLVWKEKLNFSIKKWQFHLKSKHFSLPKTKAHKSKGYFTGYCFVEISERKLKMSKEGEE